MVATQEEFYLSGDDKLSDFPQKYNRLVKAVERLFYVTTLLAVVLLLIEIMIFFPWWINNVFNFFRLTWWNHLSEGYKILILSILLVPITGIITHVINKKYIDPLLINSANTTYKK